MRSISRIILVIAITGTLSACSGYGVQTSSGEAYLAGYTETSVDADGVETVTYQNIDERIARAAAVEPNLQIPGHFGVARIVNGKLSPIPDSEARLWGDMAERLGNVGTFQPVSPIVAELAWHNEYGRRRYNHSDIGQTIDLIRLGAARQHMDAVLVYEVSARSRKDNTVFAFADITVVGGAFLPTREINAEGQAAALLVDVRNGYPYGTAHALSDLSSLFVSWGSDRQAEEKRQEVIEAVVKDLIPEVESMIVELKDALPNSDK